MVDRRHKVLVAVTTLFFVLIVLGFVFFMGTMAHETQQVTSTRPDDHSSSMRVINDHAVGNVRVWTAAGNEDEGQDQDVAVFAFAKSESGSGGGQDEYVSDYEEADSEGNNSLGDASKDDTDGDSVFKSGVNSSKPTPTVIYSSATSCGDDKPFVPVCYETTPWESMLRRAEQATFKLSYLNDECTGVLLGNGSSNAYLLTAARCAHSASMAWITTRSCLDWKDYGFNRNHVYHINTQLDYAILKINTSNDINMSAIAQYAHLSRRGPTFDMAVFIPHYSAAGPAAKTIAVAKFNKPITIKPYVPSTVEPPVNNPYYCEPDIFPSSRISYSAPPLDNPSRGAPVFSVTEGVVVAIHLCGGCGVVQFSTALSSKSIIEDLEAKGKLRSEFVAP